jgi:hypothetical protein
MLFFLATNARMFYSHLIRVFVAYLLKTKPSNKNISRKIRTIVFFFHLSHNLNFTVEILVLKHI